MLPSTAVMLGVAVAAVVGAATAILVGIPIWTAPAIGIAMPRGESEAVGKPAEYKNCSLSERDGEWERGLGWGRGIESGSETDCEG